jgi:drug/metabolite transporter (DMT)-like permease
VILSYITLAGAVLLGIVGQFLLKDGAGAPDFLGQLFRPTTLVGLAGYGLAAVLYMIALRKLPVSIAYPSVSLSYAVVAALAHWLWREPLAWPQIGGILLVMAGVALINAPPQWGSG